MYEVIKSVIETGNYELSDMLKKIDTVWLQSGITDEQRTELIELARANANTQNSIDLIAKVEELDKRVKALEESDKPKEEEDEELYPEYVPGKWYYNGDKCSEDGKNYICTAPEGRVCTWSPSEYPPYWELQK